MATIATVQHIESMSTTSSAGEYNKSSNKRKFEDEGPARTTIPSGSDSEEERGQHSPPHDSSSSSSSSDDDEKHVAAVHAIGGTSNYQQPRPLPYVRLDQDFAESLCWSNDPGQLSLPTYFDPDKPNLASDFQVPGLLPILREEGGFDRFILTDAKKRFYVWDEWDGRLFWVRHKEIEYFSTIEEQVDFVIGGLGGLEVEPVSCTRHPAESSNLETLRRSRPRYLL